MIILYHFITKYRSKYPAKKLFYLIECIILSKAIILLKSIIFRKVKKINNFELKKYFFFQNVVNEVKSLKNEVSGVGVGVHRFVHNSPIHGGQHHSHRHHVHHVHHNSISPNRLSGGRQNHLSPPPDPLPRSNSDSSIHQNTYPGKMMTNGPAAFRKGSLYHIFLLVHCVRMFYHYT